jgi:hypothetical protein
VSVYCYCPVSSMIMPRGGGVPATSQIRNQVQRSNSMRKFSGDVV